MKKLPLALSVGAIALALTLTGCATADQTANTTPSNSAPDSTGNAADEMFVLMMLPHHQQAVDMADIMLGKDDVDPQVAELAQKVREAQGPEIDRMLGWLGDWGVNYDVNDESMAEMDHGAEDAMDGMLSDEDVTLLENADGPTASRMFLEQMIEHHNGAVDMAESALQDAQNTDVRELAQQVIDDQTAEIAVMQELLTKL